MSSSRRSPLRGGVPALPSHGLLAALGLGLVLLAGSPAVRADLALATKSGCTICHQMDTKIIGPAYKDVAAKYRGDAAAPAMLEAKVKNGGVGTWGQIPMPPNVAVDPETIKVLVTWILSL
jgi:cytochrome c